MNTRNEIQDELKALDSSLTAGQNSPTLSVPEGYFDGLAASIMARIRAGEESASEEIAGLSPLLAGISRTMPFSVPDQYFADNLESLHAVVAEEPVSSFLASLPKSMPYELPSGYFEGLAGQVTERVEKPKARVVSMGNRSWMRWAAAAMIAGVITISGISYFGGRKQQDHIGTTQSIAGSLKNVSDKDIEEFVRSAGAPVTAQAKPEKKNEVKSLLQDVSQKDLDAFLSQIPAEDEELALN